MKINVKKLNQYYLSAANSDEMKTLVNICVENFVSGEVKNPVAITILRDLGLLIDMD